jgi:hypothetical protein
VMVLLGAMDFLNRRMLVRLPETRFFGPFGG